MLESGGNSKRTRSQLEIPSVDPAKKKAGTWGGNSQAIRFSLIFAANKKHLSFLYLHSLIRRSKKKEQDMFSETVVRN